ncbi:MAG: TlyA family RNA methyltransferase [Anaerolineaceae bacterium]|nr:TlyA family RNA methyltransferase [Anaerolineaceae bacterium]
MKKSRLDLLLVEKKLAESRSKAQRLIMAAQIRVNGQIILKPSTKVSVTSDLSITKEPRFVSRGGEKLEKALNDFGLDSLSGLVCADVGSSTGGFTDCLLQYGAARVYAIDVGYGLLHWKLRNNPKVVSMERTNARYLVKIEESIHFVTIDASFIPLNLLLPTVKGWFEDSGGSVIALIKPQFEAGRSDVAKGKGVIRDSEIHKKVVLSVLEFVIDEGYSVNGLLRSPLLGPKGNTEFLTYLKYPGVKGSDFRRLIDAVFKPAENGNANQDIMN